MNCRPEICAIFQLNAPGMDKAQNKQFESLNKAMNHMKKTGSIVPKFIRLDENSVRAAVLLNPSSARTTGMKGKIGLVPFMAKDHNYTNVVHYRFSGRHNVAPSVMAAEMHLLAHMFDHTYEDFRAPE